MSGRAYSVVLEVLYLDEYLFFYDTGIFISVVYLWFFID